LISVKINGSIDKYNSNSDYYNNICYKTTSESGTDISLKDRRNEYVYNNMSLCEENCNLIEYIKQKEKVKCSCNMKLNIPPDYDIKFNKKEFFKSFINIKNILNLNVMKCYKTVLKINSLINNYGFLIACLILILYFIDLFFFILISFKNIKKEIIKIVFILKHKKNSKRIKKFHDKNENKNSANKAIESFYLKVKNKMKPKNFSRQKTQNNINKSYKKINSKTHTTFDKNNIYKDKLLLKKDFELNLLDYEEALKLDHRNYCEYYVSLLKYNHPISFSFGTYNDYNSKVIKTFLFFFSFFLDLSINALFFTDDTMHKIYEDKGKFNLLYQIYQILYSTIISRFIDSFIRNFALTKDKIIALKRKIIKRGHKIYKKFKRMFIIKFIIFYISTFISLLFFCYYISCFCGIYINTQIHLIKDSIFSLIISLLIPFALYIIPGIFRISSLRVKKPTRKYLYKFSIFIENWFC